MFSLLPKVGLYDLYAVCMSNNAPHINLWTPKQFVLKPGTYIMAHKLTSTEYSINTSPIVARFLEFLNAYLQADRLTDEQGESNRRSRELREILQSIPKDDSNGTQELYRNTCTWLQYKLGNLPSEFNDICGRGRYQEIYRKTRRLDPKDINSTRFVELQHKKYI